MTDADEALLWAREQAKQLREAPNDPTRDLSAEIDAGKHDDELSDMAHGYRAGAAASAERIKELELKVAEQEAALGFYADSSNWQSPSRGFAAQYDPLPSAVSRDRGAQARALLKEGDQ